MVMKPTEERPRRGDGAGVVGDEGESQPRLPGGERAVPADAGASTRRERDRVRGWGAGAARLARSGSDLDDRLLGGRGPAGYCWYGRTSVVLGYALGPPVGGIQHTGRRRGDSDEPGD